MGLLVTPDSIAAASARIRNHVRRTPLLELAGNVPGRVRTARPVSLKLEFLQHTGSFKPRGAFNNVLSRPVPEAGVTAASGGNHGAAVAYAAARMGHRARIFIPEIASPVKVAKIRSFGAEVMMEGASYFDARRLSEAYARESGSLVIEAYDSPQTICGQGSIGLEWEQDLASAGSPPLDTVLVAVGGGGLIAGIAAWLSGRVKVVGVEPERARALHAALRAGRPVAVENNSVANDSLGARQAGDLVYAIANQAVDHVVLVSDAAIGVAQATLLEELCALTEPGGATAFAALMSGAYRPDPDERVGVLLCGGNVDLATFSSSADHAAA